MNVNWLAVVVCAIVSMVIGSIWYGPLFGKKFRVLMGMDKLSPEQQEAMKKSMTGAYILQLLGSLVMFYVLARFINDSADWSVKGGVIVALWVWIGFLVPTHLGQAIWGGKKQLFWLAVGNSLLTLLATGAIIGAWK